MCSLGRRLWLKQKALLTPAPGPELTLAPQKEGGKDEGGTQTRATFKEVSQRMGTACRQLSGEQRGGGEVVASGFLARVTPDQSGAPVLPYLICSRQVKNTQSLQGLSCWCPQGSLCPRLLVRLLCHHSIRQGLWGRW